MQLERALALLYSYPAFADEAVHLALALHHAGLLAVSQQRAADGLLLQTPAGAASPQLCLPTMLEYAVGQWAWCG